MVDVLRQGVAWLHESVRKLQLVEPVTYERDGTSFEIDATVGRAGSAYDDELGILINTRNQDFLFDPGELAQNGIDEPERGDTITRVVGDDQITYEVASDGDEPPYRAMSRYRLGFRVHTVRIDTAPAPPPEPLP